MICEKNEYIVDLFVIVCMINLKIFHTVFVCFTVSQTRQGEHIMNLKKSIVTALSVILAAGLISGCGSSNSATKETK